MFCNRSAHVPDLRVAIDRPDLLQALFPVVAQGLLPGEQTIYRAEVAALVQVVRLAAALPQQTFHAWADSSSALSVVQKWLDSTVDEPFSSSAGDLLALLPHRRPSNLVLHKVKSHQHLHEVSEEELLPALGNHAADLAAKAAEKEDLNGLSDQLASIADWYELQENNLFACFQYLLELTKAVGQLRSASQTTTDDNLSADADATRRTQQWCALDDQYQQCSPPPPGPPDLESRLQRTTAWPTGFLHSIYDWSRQLQWPTAAAPAVHALTGITFLELLANFVVCTGRLPPLRVTTCAKPGWVDLVDSSGILRPVVLRDVLLGFLAAVKSLDKLLGIRCWPSQRHHRLHSLKIFGHRDGRKGLLLRPKLPCLNQTGDVVSKLVETGCGEVLRDVALKWRLPS